MVLVVAYHNAWFKYGKFDVFRSGFREFLAWSNDVDVFGSAFAVSHYIIVSDFRLYEHDCGQTVGKKYSVRDSNFKWNKSKGNSYSKDNSKGSSTKFVLSFIFSFEF